MHDKKQEADFGGCGMFWERRNVLGETDEPVRPAQKQGSEQTSHPLFWAGLTGSDFENMSRGCFLSFTSN